MPAKKRPASRIMYIEHKGEDGLVGNARIGRVKFSRSGKSLHYGGKTFETLKGYGFKSNFFDVETGEHYWISGCRKDGRDALYSTTVSIDNDVREEYWLTIRHQPECVDVTCMQAMGKY